MTKQEINHINSADVNIQDATPVMQQYLEIKRKNPDILLLYRLGDFYETFFEDAEIMAKELELTLTGRDAGPILGRVPLAGIPAKALNNYVGKLIEKGYKAAVCEQLEDPKSAKGLVKRGIVQILTSGTLTDSNLLEQNSNNYICAIFREKESYGFAYTDISTGEFKATQTSLNLVLSELARIKPSEIVAPAINQKLMPFQIVPEQIPDLPEEITQTYKCSLLPKSVFEENFAKTNLKAVFKTNSLEAMGYNDYPLAFRASAAVLGYIWENLKDSFPMFDRIETYELSEYMMIDANTRKNLELTETLREKNKYGSLLWAIDKTQTNMGARLLKSWICQPLKNISEIKYRQDIVEELFNNNEIRLGLAEVLKNIYDIQRLATRLSNGTASPRDFLSMKLSLFNLPELFNLTSQMENNLFEKAETYKDSLSEFADIIERTIEEDAPIQIKEGGLIKSGVNNDLDYLKDLMNNGEKWLKEFEETEKEKTGIKNLKVGYNRVFGYYIEVTNSNLSQIPSNYVRKQTLTGGERFITDELKKYENDVLSAQTKAFELEYKLFCDLRNYSKEYVEQIREVAQRVAELDVLLSFATNALENNYVRPEIDESTDFIIRNGRHAVLEKILPLGTYVSNDLELSGNNKKYTQFMILTGPNMAGKSTYMRQNALILILAQIGSFIPADYGKIGIADKLFTRVGASDDLTLGQSTFMVEMIEAAYILNTATERSFILIDEIGRGTSTYDGVAIAWSVAEHIATKIGARCIFATHYHELNVMTNTYPQIKNYRITVSEENGKIEFLRKIVPGGASKSYGIHVAQMAGLPNSVINRSKDLMQKMQKNFSKNLSTKKQVSEEDLVPQLNLF